MPIDMLSSRLLRLAPLATLALLPACTVGPDYRGAPALNAGSAQAFVRASNAGASAATPLPSTWWRSLGDAQLDTLIETALAHNQNLQAAQARLRESRAQLRQQQASELPSFSADAAAVRLRQPDTSSLSSSQNAQNGQGGQNGGTPSGSATRTGSGRGPLQLYTAGFDASWEVDLFGGTRRAVENATAQAEAVEADLADTQVSLAAEVAQAYLGLRDQQQRLALARQSADLEQRTLELVRQRREHGVATDADVERQTSQVENTRANQIPLDEQITESLDQLAVLTGQAPGALDRELSAPAPLPSLPAEVPVGDPAALLKRRPDIRAAERRLAASQAQIGQREADLFPKVTLLGALGSAAADPGHLTRKSALTWLAVPYLQWDIFDFGRTRSGVRAAEAARDEASAQYSQTVLAALQDANNALSRFGHQRESVARLQQVQASADRSEVLMEQRYAAGASSLIDLLDTQRTQFNARQNLAQAQADLLKDFASLQKSLGLGWQEQAR